MLIFVGPRWIAVFLARIVMPFSRSRSVESSTRSADVLVLTERARLPEHGVDEGRLAVVDMGDDRDVAKVVAAKESHSDPAG